MKRFAMLILLGICLFSAACSREGRITKRGKEEIPVSIISDSTTILSDCILRLSVESEDMDLKDHDFRYYWFVNGKLDETVNNRRYKFCPSVDEPEFVTITVNIESEEYYGTVDLQLEVLPTPFRNPLDRNLNLTEDPVFSKGEAQFFDPGAIYFENGQFHCFYNAVFDYPNILFDPVLVGYTVSDDGVYWTELQGIENPVLTVEQVGEVLGFLPINIQCKSILRDGDNTTMFFSVANSARNNFYGNLYRADLSSAGEWIVSSEPVLEVTPRSWEKGYIGMPEIFRMPDGEYRLYYVSADGDVGLATSDDGFHFTKRPEPLLNAIRANILQMDWGWILLSEGDVFLSLDGLDWFRYKEKLLSADDVSDRDSTGIYTCEALIYENQIYYYIEFGNGFGDAANVGTNTYLMTWEL